jgi:hypothetical protein
MDNMLKIGVVILLTGLQFLSSYTDGGVVFEAAALGQQDVNVNKPGGPRRKRTSAKRDRKEPPSNDRARVHGRRKPEKRPSPKPE